MPRPTTPIPNNERQSVALTPQSMKSKKEAMIMTRVTIAKNNLLIFQPKQTFSLPLCIRLRGPRELGADDRHAHNQYGHRV